MCISSCSELLLNQIKLLLKKLGVESQVRQKHYKGFVNNRNNNNSYQLNIRKIEEIEKFFSVIKPNNPRHQTRFLVWKKFGYLEPNTTISDRIKLLETLQR